MLNSVKRFVFSLLCTLLFSAMAFSQTADTANIITDSLKSKNNTASADTTITEISIPGINNKILNSGAPPVSLTIKEREVKSKDTLYYLITAIVFILAFLKYFNSRYFNNLFRVFFNTSLRQSQLTDQLLQSGLTSLMFNIFFILSGGMFLYLLLLHFNLIHEKNNLHFLAIAISLLGIIYLAKYCTLKFIGWITGLTGLTDTYLFIIFLINKIIAVFLIPVIVIIAFAENKIAHVAAIISGLSIAVFLLLRFFRSYGLLQQQLKISRFHFVLYLAGIEILPLLILYKGLMVYLSKNL